MAPLDHDITIDDIAALEDLVARALRARDDWIDPAVVALNRHLAFSEPITPAEGQVFYREDRDTFPKLLKLQRLERWWQETIRRRTYQWFIWTTFDT